MIRYVPCVSSNCVWIDFVKQELELDCRVRILSECMSCACHLIGAFVLVVCCLDQRNTCLRYILRKNKALRQNLKK